MPSTAHISRRDHIKWGHSPPSEPTTTLVLTTKSGWYIDVRILLSPANRHLSSTSVSKPEGSILSNKEDLILEKETRSNAEENLASLGIERLDWGFAGQASSTPHPSGSGPSHSKWEHWVDSKTTLDEPPVSDEGDMFPQPDGRTLEKGRMVNPGSGVEEDYEELWSDQAIEKPPSWTDEGRLSCVVFKCEAEGFKGSIVRLGSYCQGVLRVGDGFCAERWKVASGEDVGKDEGKWIPLAKAGEGSVGCEGVLDLDDRSVTVGRGFMVDGKEWKVTEVNTDW
jgi:hypothetical protein